MNYVSFAILAGDCEKENGCFAVDYAMGVLHHLRGRLIASQFPPLLVRPLSVEAIAKDD
jgi:hypothetical protein